METIVIDRKVFETQREQIQHDLDCILDGIPNEIFTQVCKVIVDRFAIMEQKVPE